MKTLTVTVLICALMALASATALLPAPDEDQAVDTEDTALFERWACPSGWTQIGGRCFQYVPYAKSWALSERHCMSMGAHLASIHSTSEYHDIQRMIAAATHYSRDAWVGGSDAQQNGIWFWSDGAKFHFSSWCPGEPNNQGGEDCLQINFSGDKCWNDIPCGHHKPFVCAMAPK